MIYVCDVRAGVQFHYFACGCPVVLEPSGEEVFVYKLNSKPPLLKKKKADHKHELPCDFPQNLYTVISVSFVKAGHQGQLRLSAERC